MASTPATNAIGVELQAAGENLNTWGDPKLNNALQILVNLAHGWKAWTINGAYTVSETNYSTTNDTENAFIKLVAGTVAAAFNVTIPGRAKRLFMWNATSYAATVKLAATSGVTIPAGGFAIIATDGSTDVYNVGPTHAGTSTQATQTNAYALWGAVETAIAAAGTLTPATVRVSAADTTSAFLATKLVEGTGIDLTDSGAGNATLTIAVDTTELEEFLALIGKITATLSSGTTAMTARRRYRISSTATGTLPSMVAGDFVIVEFTNGAGVTATVGRNSQTIDGASADDTYVGTGSQGPVVRYDYVSAGVVTSRLIEGIPA